jgi:O-methyltransferase involved in polyketide biosynthesis
VLIGFLPPEAEVRLLDAIIPLSSEGSRFAADFGTVAPTTPEGQEQTRLMTEGWRRQGLDLDIAGLAYPGEHTDVAAYLAANGWDTTTFRLTDLFSAAGLPELGPSEHQVPADTISFVRAVRL